jgi:DNA-binding protein HU-beta
MSIADSKNEVFLMADKALTKSQIIAYLADKTGLQKKVVVNFLEEVVALAYKEAKNGFTLPGLGKLVIQQRKARLGRNPKTGETLKIPAKKVLKFKIAKVCKDNVCPQKKK